MLKSINVHKLVLSLLQKAKQLPKTPKFINNQSHKLIQTIKGGLKMTIIKVNLHKVSAERSLTARGGQIKINNNVSIKDVEDLDFEVSGKKGLKFTFTFNCSYEPDLGKIDVEGQVIYVGNEAKVKEIKKGWDEHKKVPIAVTEEVVNAALHKGNIQAIKISEEVSLPSPLPLPKLQKQIMGKDIPKVE